MEMTLHIPQGFKQRGNDWTHEAALTLNQTLGLSRSILSSLTDSQISRISIWSLSHCLLLDSQLEMPRIERGTFRMLERCSTTEPQPLPHGSRGQERRMDYGLNPILNSLPYSSRKKPPVHSTFTEPQKLTLFKGPCSSKELRAVYTFLSSILYSQQPC